MKQVFGVFGSSVLLESGHGDDLHGREIVWEFTCSDGHQYTIVDVGPNHPGVKPNEHFEGRLNFNHTTGALLLSNLSTSDQGYYTISVDGKEQRTINVQIIEMKPVFGVFGSSVLLESGHGDDLHGRKIVWEFTRSDGDWFTIVNVAPNHPGEKPNKHFEGRLNFNPSTGALLLSNLSTSDQGYYTISVDGKEQRTINVQIIDKLSQPSIQGRSGCLGSTIQLICQVIGNARAYQWRKDGGEMPPHHQLLDRNRKLVISNASKGDSGIYICVASNPVTSVQANYTLTIHGLSASDAVIVAVPIIAVVFSSANLITSIFAHCWKMKSGKELPRCRFWTPFLFICNTVPFVVFLVTLFHWNMMKGSDSLPVIATCISILLVLTLIQLFAVQRLNCWRIFRCHRRTELGNLFLFGLHTALIIISVAFWSKEIHQNYQGCNVEIWSLLLTSKVEYAVVIFVSFMIYCCRNKCNRNENGPQGNKEFQNFQPIRTDDPGSLHTNWNGP
ncbi:uncharacterized protein LOC127585946 isoform X2 [Pristis pectinata]|nr:uncharacterized protein LOC127585946 isoform X2 [Pristis pectinata]